MSEFVTHDVKQFVVSRPSGFSFEPGQAVNLAIDRPQWHQDERPFTPTCLTGDRILEFTIKRYPAHEGVTRELHKLSPGTELLLSEPFGTIAYRGAGVFIAGGAGITPFLAILRERICKSDLDGHYLIFSNKTVDDIICEKELRYYFGSRCILITTAAQAKGYEHSRIDRDFLRESIDNFDQRFYVCGPPGFMKSVNKGLQELGADSQSLVFER